ncbi:MAG: T9SS type A sorting domain-containing protein [Chitinophagales bacterium]|nr:T9SS type A sorting domain-containing protein [Chitinophagales bacterium]
MLHKYTLAGLLIFQFYTLFAQFPDFSDSLTLSWERMAGPPAWIHQYAETSGRMFAAAEETLFVTTDNGESWEIVESFGRKRIRQLFAKDSVVIVIAEEPKLLEPGNPFSQIYQHQIWRSEDQGITWSQVHQLIRESETAYGNVPFEIYATNNNTLIFSYLYYPGLGFGKQIQLWGSADNGLNWQKFYDDASFLYVRNDTMSFIKPGGIQAAVCKSNIGVLNEQIINLSGAAPLGDSLIKMFYVQGALHLIKTDNTWRKTEDLGQNWTVLPLPVSGQIKNIVVQEERFYLHTDNGLYTGLVSNPMDLQWVYQGEHGQSAFANSFFPSEFGLWVNTDLNQTVFTVDNGQTWTARSNGLSAKVGAMSSYCSTLWAKSLGKETQDGRWYYSDTPEEIWTQNHDVYYDLYTNSGNSWQTIAGQLIRYIPVAVQRSQDCGQTWDTIPVPFHFPPTGMVQHQGWLILYSKYEYGFWLSADNGDTWTSGLVPNTQLVKMVSADNFLIANYANRMYFSSDLGLNWEERSLPLNANDMYFRDGKLVIRQIPNEDGVVKIAESTDYGQTWIQTVEIPIPDWQPTIIPYRNSEWIIMHLDYKLWISADDGQHWTRLYNLPFNSRLAFYNNIAIDTFIPRASRYFILEDQLYAATESHGLWRCSADSIAAHLQGTSHTFMPKQLPERWSIAPNPSSGQLSVFLETAFAENIEMCLTSLEGRQIPLGQWQLHAGANTLSPDLSRFPAGVYFLSIQTPRGRSTQKVWLMK